MPCACFFGCPLRSCHLDCLLELLMLCSPLILRLLILDLASGLQTTRLCDLWLRLELKTHFWFAWTCCLVAKEFALVHGCFAIAALPRDFIHFSTYTSMLHFITHTELLLTCSFLFQSLKFALGLFSGRDLEIYVCLRHLVFLRIFRGSGWPQSRLKLWCLFLFLSLFEQALMLYWHGLCMILRLLLRVAEYILCCHSAFMSQDEGFSWLA